MKVFISWSGRRGQAIAEQLHGWIPCIIQEAEVWVSAQDIEKGQRWLSSVTDNLAETNFGLVIVTPESQHAPWLMFEAGALSKSIDSRVIALLCGLQHSEIAGTPLFQFQNANPDKEDMLRTIGSINKSANRPLPQDRLFNVFEKFWPDFSAFYAKLDAEQPERASDDKDSSVKIFAMMEEISRSIRGLKTAPIHLSMADNKLYRASVPPLNTPYEFKSRIDILKKSRDPVDGSLVIDVLREILENSVALSDRGNVAQVFFDGPINVSRMGEAISYLKSLEWVAVAQPKLFE